MAKIENQTTLYKQNIAAIQSKLVACGFPADNNVPIWALPDALDAVLGLHEVFVVSKNDMLYTIEQIQKMTARQIASTISAVRGILLCAEGHRLLIAPTDAWLEADDGSESYTHYWGGYQVELSMNNISGVLGVVEQAATSAADMDFQGWAKTQIMKEELEDTQVVAPAGGSGSATQVGSAAYRAVAAYELNSKISGGAQGWYLPAAGELALIYRHLFAVNELMDVYNNRAGIGAFERLANAYYWSSSETSANTAWLVYLGNGYMGNYSKFSQGRVRAVAAFQ